MYLLILTLIFALLIAIFAIQNAIPVTIQFFWITTQVPLVLIILGSVLAGALIVFLIASYRQFRPKGKDNFTKLYKETDKTDSQNSNSENSDSGPSNNK
ncbi:lipopolysaccharide assembly LapA domain-containing protein [Desulfitobacterium sp. Sab5]|uniref:LapA family protein n=1 Tax=Desulfitobacterium nosdiversum TaxID=3375356 RepID=UPI003CF7BC30